MKKKIIILFLRFSMVILLVVILFFLVRIDFLKVKEITCKNQYGPCEEKDNEVASSFKGANFFFLSESKIRGALLQNFSNREVVIQRIFPNRLEIVVEARKLLVAIAQESLAARGSFLVDQDGVVVEFIKDNTLPLLVIKDKDVELAVGTVVGDELRQASDVVYLLYRAQGAKKAILQDNFLQVYLPEAIEVYFPIDKDPKTLVGALQLILARSRIDGELPKSIDLRYSNPVLKY